MSVKIKVVIVGALVFGALCTSALAQKQSDVDNLVKRMLRGSGDTYKLKFELFQLAKSGNTYAQEALGGLYESGANGTGIVSHSRVEAVFWFKKASEQGSASAQRKLGVLYYYDNQFNEALYWWTRSATQGDGPSAKNLGLLYAQGKLGVRDLKKAQEWFAKAKGLSALSEEELNQLIEKFSSLELAEKAAAERAEAAKVEAAAAAERLMVEKAAVEREAAAKRIASERAELERHLAERETAKRNTLPGFARLSRVAPRDASLKEFTIATVAPVNQTHLEAEALLQSIMNRRLAHCRDGDLINKSDLIIQSRHNFGFGVTPVTLNEADRLNGKLWEGEIFLVRLGGPFRQRSAQAQARFWSEWTQGEAEILSYAILTRKIDRTWEISTIDKTLAMVAGFTQLKKRVPLTEDTMSKYLGVGPAPPCYQ